MLVGVVVLGILVTSVSTTSDDFESSLNSSANETSSRVDNVSCNRECLDSNPSKGPGYYMCLENSGCN